MAHDEPALIVPSTPTKSPTDIPEGVPAEVAGPAGIISVAPDTLIVQAPPQLFNTIEFPPTDVTVPRRSAFPEVPTESISGTGVDCVLTDGVLAIVGVVVEFEVVPIVVDPVSVVPGVCVG
jgi:hypothetical protein